MKLKYTLSACVDCIAFDANGDIPEERPNIADDIRDHLGLKPDEYLVSASGLDESGKWYRNSKGRIVNPEHPEYEMYCEDWFAWSACECCGSTLGGNRNRLAVLYPGGRK